MKKRADLFLYNASELVTLAGNSPKTGENMQELGIVADGAIAMRNGSIAAAGTFEEVRSTVEIDSDTRMIDAGGSLVTPGLVDAHTHLVFAGTREDEYVMKIVNGMTYEQIEACGGGVLKTVAHTRLASHEELLQQARRVTGRMLNFGTTTIEAKSGYALHTRGEIRLLEVMGELSREGSVDIVPTLFGAHDLPPEYRSDPDAFLRLIIEEMIPAVAAGNNARFCDSGVTFPPEQTEKIFEAAMNHGLKIKVHADEFHHAGGASMAVRCGAVSAEHCLHSTDSELDEMPEKGVIAVLLPAVPIVHRLGQFVNARRFIDRGVAVALGTDYNPSCLVDSMPLVMSLACYTGAMAPSEALAAATVNAAWAIGCGETAGSLEPGKQADIVIWDVSNHLQLTERLSGAPVKMVIKKGEVVFSGSNALKKDGH